MIETLVDRARLHGQMLVAERQLDHFPRRYRKNSVFSVDPCLELGPHFFEDDPKAWCVDHPMAREHEFTEVTIGSIRNDEIGIEEQKKGVCHLSAEIEETAIKCLGQHNAIVARKIGHQVIDWRHLGGTGGGEPLEGAGVPDQVE